MSCAGLTQPNVPMDYRVYLLFLVGVVGAAQFFASSQTTETLLVAQRDALMPERGAAERSVERTWALEAAGGVPAERTERATEAIRCDSLSFAGGGPVCHTTAPELVVVPDGSGTVRVSAVRRTPQGSHVVARARVRGVAARELRVETLP